jgi:hypothetical protein
LNASIKTVALKACRHFMVPIARFMLGIGVSYKEFAEISKLAFVQVASDEYGVRGRKTNMSRVSVMTGLNRKEIRKIRERLKNEDWSLDPELSKPASLLSVWFTEPRYLEPNGSPLSLAFEASSTGPSFTELVREVGGDIPPGAMLKELIRAGCVTELQPGVWKAIRRQYSPSGVDVFQVQRFGECLHDLAETISTNYLRNTERSQRLFEFRAVANGIDPSATQELKKLVVSKGESYLELVDNWLTAHTADAASRESQAIRCGVGVYYFESSQDAQAPLGNG